MRTIWNKKIIVRTFLLWSVLWGYPFTGDAKDRIIENFNFGWKFQLGEVENGERIDLDDTAWRTVNVPHDYQIEKTWLTPENWKDEEGKVNISKLRQLGARGFKMMGSGWYRKTFTPDSTWRDKRVLVDFEGIMLVGDVWLNGKRMGGTDYGYSGFEIDITNELKWNESNVLAVRSNTGDYRNSRWYTGGGLFRNVNLVIKNSCLSFARHAIYITTPQVADEKAVIKLQANIENRTGKTKSAKVKVRLFDPSGTEVAEQVTDLSLNKGQISWEYPLTEMIVLSPKLWSCDSPELYKAEVILYDDDNHITDRLVETFGIRTIEYSPTFGFKLNGKKVLLKGIANHHELGALGAAAYGRAIEKRFQLLKSFGVNHIRCSHNPYSKEFMDLADRYGILIINEAFDKWSKQYVGGRAEWWSVWSYTISELIKRDRNHPSVIMWSLGNELQIREDWAGYPTDDWGVTSYRILDVMAKRYDSTRPTTVAMYPRRRVAVDLPPELSLATDVASFNYTYRDFKRDAKRFPQLCIYQSEASIKEMGPNFYNMALDSVVGLAYWGAIDYLGESQGWPYKGWRQGVFHIDLQPKPQAYLLKSIFSDEPVVHIGIVEKESDLNWNDVMVGVSVMGDHWNYLEGSTLKLYTYTNADEVELFVNGRSLGRKSNQLDHPERRNQILWENVTYQIGNVTAVAYKKGKEVARHRIETTGKAVKLVIEPDENPWIATGTDVKYVRIYAVDGKGRRVPEANQLLTFKVDGGAQIVAVDNGDLTSDEMYVGTQRSLYQGAALVILRSGKTAGKVTLSVASERYKTVKTELNINSVKPN